MGAHPNPVIAEQDQLMQLIPKVNNDVRSQNSVSEDGAVSLHDAHGYLNKENFLDFNYTEEQIKVRDPA